ncbi:Mannosylfructose-phosphate synthase [Pseudobythopirellula maris]|uniref:Sucrose synthase n=1 Tax=Pseudobythopirellula maris TaxID=2527991 RepID=A0A5C5ZTG8_9BACT|nr:sucrose synthase [Pseudobythopirellula maris]TWT90131.1 Mannosylfructose-phosphate synthase [Pseudobythopirellula maris]
MPSTIDKAKNSSSDATTKEGAVNSVDGKANGSGGRTGAYGAQPPYALIQRFFTTLKAAGEPLVVGHGIATALDEFVEHQSIEPADEKLLRKLLRGCSEVILLGDSAYAALRPAMGKLRLIHAHPAASELEEISPGEFLRLKDSLIQGNEEASRLGLVIDTSPFYRNFPVISDPSEVGDGVDVLNRHLSAQMHQNPERFREALLDFLRDEHVGASNLLLNDHIATLSDFKSELAAARSLVDDLDADQAYHSFSHELRTHGFEAGWGDTAATVSETLALLHRVMQSADPDRFARLLSRLPITRTVLMVSPHGWFAQEGVLGKPDTGGQVTYVLDQARALERTIDAHLKSCGVDMRGKVVVLTRLIPEAEGTACDNPLEKIHGTHDSWIVRVPFRDGAGEVAPHWVSRFKIWPYLERYAEESTAAVVNELGGKPDLIVGHYSDGNITAHLLAERLDVTHAACVHALEKSKYLFSDSHWAELEDQYHFSAQFTADLVAYNSADFVVSSSRREIGGTPHDLGMLESYQLFTMPGLFRVESGLDPRRARHNIVPPGVSEECFFPNTAEELRVEAMADGLRERLLTQEPGENCVGFLDEPDKPFVFAMARIDKVKNLTGLADLFGKCEKLREHANLLLVTSINERDQASDPEELEEVDRLYELIARHSLEGSIRWAAARLDKAETGEIYRILADRRSVFAQPALMETFGLTVIEAMACGMPVVGTAFGGPAEIILDGECGEVRDPNDHEAFAQSLLDIVSDTEKWRRYSEEGIQRVETAFRWARHAESLLRISNVYTYWNHTDVMNRPALDRYLHTLYHTVYRPRADAIEI